MSGGFRIVFQWDAAKSQANIKKHRVSFVTASKVFGDPFAITRWDADHSDNEERWFTIGNTLEGECMVVVHTWEDLDANSAKVRIISARKATKAERKWRQEI